MAKRIELTSEKNFIGDSKYKSDDGLVYEIHYHAVSVRCSDEARYTLVHADTANEAVIDGNVYPVVETCSFGFIGCTSLEKLTFPANMKRIANYTFT